MTKRDCLEWLRQERRKKARYKQLRPRVRQSALARRCLGPFQQELLVTIFKHGPIAPRKIPDRLDFGTLKLAALGFIELGPRYALLHGNNGDGRHGVVASLDGHWWVTRLGLAEARHLIKGCTGYAVTEDGRWVG